MAERRVLAGLHKADFPDPAAGGPADEIVAEELVDPATGSEIPRPRRSLAAARHDSSADLAE